ncbi:MAG: cation-translocating P-type ATPase [Chloroflexi bacterium]|nr:cation-translocating P-type ATPase [Chloroflexota bacterium]
MSEKYDLNDLNSINGLSDQQVEESIKKNGFNEIPSAKKRSLLKLILEVVREPMLLLLLAGGFIYMILGDVQEAVMLLFFVFVIIGIALYQERKTERTLEALRDLSSPRALVIRNGKAVRIAGREVVPGDILILAEGDRVPADGIFLSGDNLTIEESLLTGESIPVFKTETSDEISEMERPGGENTPYVFSGTLVVSGMGIIRVINTGLNTEFGKIGKSLQKIKSEKTKLQKETGHLVRNLAIIGLSLCVIIVIVYSFTSKNIIDGLLAGITLAMAILPEEFPVVFTVFLALGAWRISKSNVLTRRMPAIETLGSNTVLCVDKTGTLTVDYMHVETIFAAGEFFNIDHKVQIDPPEKFHELIEFSILASQPNPFDPMEKALKEMGTRYRSLTEHMHSGWELMREYPLSRKLLAVTRVCKLPDYHECIIATKGAPEAIFNLCHLNEQQIVELSEHVASMARQGLRVLGVAKALSDEMSLANDQHEYNYQFLGFVAFSNPIRPSVPAAIKECQGAGIRVVMITGDYPATAQTVAHQIGLANPDQIITGLDMNRMDDEELKNSIKGVSIFARVVPEQKLRLVNAFKESGEIVSMTGDGVNDAPALKSADIGIAMGGRGTDVAREAGALVLLDDDFSSIVKAIRLGRRIYDNLKKAMIFILAVHVPIAGLSLIPLLLKWPMVLQPAHVVFLELIIDPACSVAFEAEPEEANIMKRLPRGTHEALLSRKNIAISLIQGLVVLTVTLLIYGFTYHTKGELEARALTFTTLVLASLGLIISNRNWSTNIFKSIRSRNRIVWWIVGCTIVFLVLINNIPFLSDLFNFNKLHLIDAGISIGASVACIFLFEVVKYFSRLNKAPKNRL